jgi:chromosome segregation ATPase
MILLAKLKRVNRHLHMSIDEQRKLLDAKKVDIEKLQLSYENLQYKKAYLHREIRECKDIQTPNLDQVEIEREQQIAAREYQPNMEDIHQQAVEQLKSEKEERISAENEYKDLQDYHSKQLEKLDRKRKFLDDLPKKVALIRTGMEDLSKEFQEICPILTNANNSEGDFSRRTGDDNNSSITFTNMEIDAEEVRG